MSRLSNVSLGVSDCVRRTEGVSGPARDELGLGDIVVVERVVGSVSHVGLFRASSMDIS
jgi:hypothetical protein